MKPISTIKADLGIETDGPIQKLFTNTCYRHMDRYVPKDTGILRRTVSLTSKTITYEQPYAHAQYVGYTKGPVKPENYTTPGTGPYWDRRMKSAEMQDIVREVQDEIRRRNG